MLCGSKADKVHILKTATTDFLVFALGSIVAAACNGVFMSREPDLRNPLHGLDVLVPMTDCLVRCMDDLGFFRIVCKARLEAGWPMSCSSVSKR